MLLYALNIVLKRLSSTALCRGTDITGGRTLHKFYKQWIFFEKQAVNAKTVADFI